MKDRLRMFIAAAMLFAAGCAAPPPVDENNRGPLLLSSVEARYPPNGRGSGEVWVRMWVNEKGKVTKASVERTPDQSLCDAALDAAVRRIYRPATLDGQPVGVWLILPIEVVPR